MIGGYGYGIPTASLRDFDEATLAGLGLCKNPIDILQAGHFEIPQSAEWEARMNRTWEQIKAGLLTAWPVGSAAHAPERAL